MLTEHCFRFSEGALPGLAGLIAVAVIAGAAAFCRGVRLFEIDSTG